MAIRRKPESTAGMTRRALQAPGGGQARRKSIVMAGDRVRAWRMPIVPVPGHVGARKPTRTAWPWTKTAGEVIAPISSALNGLAASSPSDAPSTVRASSSSVSMCEEVMAM